MRTLVGAAEPEPRPAGVATTVPAYQAWPSTTATVTGYYSWFTVAEPSAPYRTTAWVGRPVPEIES